MSEESMVEKVARAMCEAAEEDWDASSYLDTASGNEPEEQRCYWRVMARAAIEAMRNLPMEAQMAGCEAQSAKSIELDGPLKKHEDCKEPDDWMQRGHGMAKRMMSGQEFMAGWNGAIDAALKETA